MRRPNTVHLAQKATGTQSAEILTVKGRGVSRLRGSGRGDLKIGVHVVTPSRLDSKERDLIKQFAKVHKHPSPTLGHFQQGLFARAVTAQHGRPRGGRKGVADHVRIAALRDQVQVVAQGRFGVLESQRLLLQHRQQRIAQRTGHRHRSEPADGQ